MQPRRDSRSKIIFWSKYAASQIINSLILPFKLSSRQPRLDSRSQIKFCLKSETSQIGESKKRLSDGRLAKSNFDKKPTFSESSKMEFGITKWASGCRGGTREAKLMFHINPKLDDVDIRVYVSLTFFRHSIEHPYFVNVRHEKIVCRLQAFGRRGMKCGCVTFGIHTSDHGS